MRTLFFMCWKHSKFFLSGPGKCLAKKLPINSAASSARPVEYYLFHIFAPGKKTFVWAAPRHGPAGAASLRRRLCSVQHEKFTEASTQSRKGSDRLARGAGVRIGAGSHSLNPVLPGGPRLPCKPCGQQNLPVLIYSYRD